MNRGGWIREWGGGLPVHVYPINDLRVHETEGKDCWCCPKIDDEGEEIIVVHNSLDQREVFERGERKPS